MRSDTSSVGSPRFEVVRAGRRTTIQDWPGRVGHRSVGVPPSGPMDDLSFRLGNRTLGNPEGVAGLEVTLGGAAFRFRTPAMIIITGAAAPVTLDGSPVSSWTPLAVPAGGLVEIGSPVSGMRSYLLVAGGIDAPSILGSAATLDHGRLGGLAGGPLHDGDVVPLRRLHDHLDPGHRLRTVPPGPRPLIGSLWRIAALEGPHGAPEFVTTEDVEQFYAATWEVHLDSSRTGVRLVGPRPTWARRHGGEAGPHASSIHDTPYAVGAVCYADDLPVLLGPDGPSLGGSACPATVASAHRWMLGQLRPGDCVQFTPITEHQADDLRRQPLLSVAPGRPAVVDGGIVLSAGATRDRPKLTVRRSGDANLLVEYGEQVVDVGLRVRVHALAEVIVEQIACGGLVGVLDVTPGIRSLQLQLDPDRAAVSDLAGIVRALDSSLPPTRELSVRSRIVHLPMCWEDPAAPTSANPSRGGDSYCATDLESVRRMNGLAEVADIHRIVFGAEYLVVAFGDVGLGAPVASPLDPRHRLVTSTSGPPRTSTPQDAVGIGGAYLRVHGTGPSGGPLLGRTVPVWSTPARPDPYTVGAPGLLRLLDRIRWHPVTSAELSKMRAATAAGDQPLTITEGTLSMGAYECFLADNLDSIADFQHVQSSAFAAERRARERTGAVGPRSDGPKRAAVAE